MKVGLSVTAPSSLPAQSMILGVNHIGIVPVDMSKARWFFGEILGLLDLGEANVEQQMVHSYTFSVPFRKSLRTLHPDENLVNCRLEVQENLGQTGYLERFLAKRGGGIHHLAFTVRNIGGCLAYLRSSGVEIISPKPTVGVHGHLIAFIDPKSTGGILVELVEELPFYEAQTHQENHVEG